MIRTALKLQISYALGTVKGFLPEDFDIDYETTKGSRSTKVTISYSYASGYSFTADISAAKKTKESTYGDRITVFGIKTVEAPGELSASEEDTYQSERSFLDGLSSWVKRLKVEVEAAPHVRQMNEFKQRLDEFEQQLNSESAHDFFTAEEGADLRNRMEALEEWIADELRAAASDKEATEAEISALHSTIEELKASLGQLTKRGWLRKAVTRITIWGSKPENVKLLGAGVDLAKKMLPPGASGGE